MKFATLVSLVLIAATSLSFAQKNTEVQEQIDKIEEVCLATPQPEPLPQVEEIEEPEAPIVLRTDYQPTYSATDVMILANMLFGEISAVTYDKSYTEQEQDRIMQEWATIPMNHILLGSERGYADDLLSLMNLKTSAGYFIWHPTYATEAYADNARNENEELYKRCERNALAVLTHTADAEVPENVIYADCAIHGEIFRAYAIDTGWFRSTVYLCYGG